ncbi:MAG: phosphoenolpyruvate mutase [Trichocoleus desertorum ATA4-8-CV12]|nr:phosphoenolpyruvate mutase [Trichocoleus desertorum ATA4-8-CV12]
MEAHNGLSAKIVEETGFKGIWASGLSISAQLGVRDNNEASWTQVLEVIEFMSDATSIPILLDGDTGYGNFNNLQRLIRKLEQRHIAGVCIEDKIFPKTNSFINGDAQPLADIDEFCGKIKAAKDTQTDDDFVLIARIEAFIAGWGLAEALKRAEAYHAVGADGILIHSALRIPDEILAFKKEWGNRCPVVIVPTKYYATPTGIFRDHQFSIAIWANHLLRAAVTGMQKVAQQIKEEENLLNVEESVAPVSEVFRLQGADDLLEAEKRYLPQETRKVQSIILAASRGVQLGELTEDKPKCMLEVHGQPLLMSIVDTYQAVGIKNITVVRGYKKESVNVPNLKYIDNDDYHCTGELVSLAMAMKPAMQHSDELVISFGDVMYKKYILQMLLDSGHDFTVVVDADKSNDPTLVRQNYVNCSIPNVKHAFYASVYLKQVNRSLPKNEICGMWTGLLKVSNEGKQVLQSALDSLLQDQELYRQGRVTALLNELIQLGYPIHVIYVTGHWLNVDAIRDMIEAGSF